MNERPSGLLVPVSVTALVLLAAIVGWRMLPDPQAMPPEETDDIEDIYDQERISMKENRDR